MKKEKRKRKKKKKKKKEGKENPYLGAFVVSEPIDGLDLAADQARGVGRASFSGSNKRRRPSTPFEGDLVCMKKNKKN
jgi:hypothetical protein